jgi:lipopolysaccharide biosynthesis regulator YciM
MLASYRTLNRTNEGLELLKTYLQTYKLYSLLNVLYEATIAQQDAETAAKLARDELVKKPSLQTLDLLLQARLLQDEAPQDAHVIQQTVRYAIGNRSAYVCSQCGFRAKHYHWQCPACNAWESLPSEPTESVA